MPPDIFLEEVMCFPPEVVDRIKKTREELWNLELESLLEDASLEDINPEDIVTEDGEDGEDGEETELR